MSAKNNNKKRSRLNLSGLRYVGMVLLCVIVTCCLLATAFSKRTYTVVYGAQKSTVTTYETDYKEIVKETGIQLPDDAKIESTESGGETILTVITPMSVTVRCGGCTSVLTVDSPCTVADILDQLKITCGDDTINCAPTDAVYDGMEINIITRTVSYPTVSVPVDYNIVYQEDASLDEGTQQVVTQGVNGTKVVRYKCVIVNNVVQEFGVESETVTVQPTDEIIERGTRVTETESAATEETSASSSEASSTSSSSSSSSSSQTANPSSDPSADTSTDTSSSSSSSDTGSSTLSYSSVMTMTATAYTSSTTSGTTASGAPAQVGIIAADPSVLPMGTKVYITSADGSWTYGYAVVGDTGVSGNLIDLYFNTYDECISFGRQTALVYIVG